jgi:hypothetical protein
MVKLTKAQRRELAELAAADYPVGYSDDYKPIQRLCELGYVDRQEGKYSSAYTITPAGRAALADGGRDAG